MANLPGDEVHGEAIVDGDASAGIPVVLYWPGSVQVRTLGADECILVSDIQIASETGGDMWLCADGKVAGEYIFHANLAANGFINCHFEQPRACAKATGLVFFGNAANIDSCIIEGSIVKC